MTLNTNGIASDVTGKRILITGGASGIGAASALLLASRGAKVVIGDMAEEMGAAVAKQAQDAGNSVVFKKVDVTSGDEVRALFDFAMESLGGLDVVVNNAGIDHKPSPMHEPRARCDEPSRRSHCKKKRLCQSWPATHNRKRCM